MKAIEIDKIAEAVVGSLASKGDIGLMGCGAISSPIPYAENILECDFYECGGQAAFTCYEEFTCGGHPNAQNAAPLAFHCPDLFECSAQFDGGRT